MPTKIIKRIGLFIAMSLVMGYGTIRSIRLQAPQIVAQPLTSALKAKAYIPKEITVASIPTKAPTPAIVIPPPMTTLGLDIPPVRITPPLPEPLSFEATSRQATPQITVKAPQTHWYNWSCWEQWQQEGFLLLGVLICLTIGYYIIFFHLKLLDPSGFFHRLSPETFPPPKDNFGNNDSTTLQASITKIDQITSPLDPSSTSTTTNDNKTQDLTKQLIQTSCLTDSNSSCCPKQEKIHNSLKKQSKIYHVTTTLGTSNQTVYPLNNMHSNFESFSYVANDDIIEEKNKHSKYDYDATEGNLWIVPHIVK